MSEGHPIRIAGVKPVDHYVLRVSFANGKTFTVDLREFVHQFKGLRPLREHAAFARVDVGEGGHSLVWPGDIDMGADRLYEMALEQSGRADTVAFIRWRWRHGLSLSEAAEALGISRRQVAYYASGEQDVPRTILLACKGWEVEHKGVVAA